MSKEIKKSENARMQKTAESEYKEGTIGWSAEHLKVDEKELDRQIEKYEKYKVGTIGHAVYKKLIEYKEEDSLGKVLIENDTYIEREKAEQLISAIEKVRVSE